MLFFLFFFAKSELPKKPTEGIMGNPNQNRSVENLLEFGEPKSGKHINIECNMKKSHDKVTSVITDFGDGRLFCLVLQELWTLQLLKKEVNF